MITAANAATKSGVPARPAKLFASLSGKTQRAHRSVHPRQWRDHDAGAGGVDQPTALASARVLAANSQRDAALRRPYGRQVSRPPRQGQLSSCSAGWWRVARPVRVSVTASDSLSPTRSRRVSRRRRSPHRVQSIRYRDPWPFHLAGTLSHRAGLASKE